jgi:hypothetical protein
MFKNINVIASPFVRTFSKIFLIIILTYSLMAIITHASLNRGFDDYKFSQSLISIFDTKTAIFKFFVAFMIINILWILGAWGIKSIKNFINNK